MQTTDPRYEELKRLRAAEVAERIGISRQEVIELIEVLGLDRSALIREARILKRRCRVVKGNIDF